MFLIFLILSYCIIVISFQKTLLNRKNYHTYKKLAVRVNAGIPIIKKEIIKCQDLDMEVIFNENNDFDRSKPPILFIHGSYHSSWCWTENFIPYFSQKGYPTCAVSLRGTFPSKFTRSNPSRVVKIQEHIDDLYTVLQSLQIRYKGYRKPVIISHSFGGLITQKLLEIENVRRGLSGVSLLCSVAPSGNGPMTKRFLKSRFLDSLKIVYGFVFKAVTQNIRICRDLFFDESVTDHDIERSFNYTCFEQNTLLDSVKHRYMECFKADSEIGLDLKSLSMLLPSVTSMNKDGQASWISSNEKDMIPILVIGAENDFIVDSFGVQETAKYLGVEAVTVRNLYHDVMLGPKWKETADILFNWLQSNSL